MTALDLTQWPAGQPRTHAHVIGDVPVLFQVSTQRAEWRTQAPYTTDGHGDYAVNYEAATDTWSGWAARGTTAIYPVADSWEGIIHRWPHPVRVAMAEAIKAELQYIPAVGGDAS